MLVLLDPLRTGIRSTVAVLLIASGCEEPSSGRQLFERDVVPVLEQRCVSPVCHGVGPGAEEQGERVSWDQLFVEVDAEGRILDLDRAYATVLRTIDAAEDARFSTLLRKPLPLGLGGLPHYGGDAFSSEEDPAYGAVRRWIEAEPHGGEDPEPLTPEEQLFADTVLPVLVRADCTSSRCHGPEAGATPYRLDPGYRGLFSLAAIRSNYEQSLGQLSLDGDPRLSRLVRKSLPLHAGGIAHRGSNTDFFADDPRALSAIVEWACAERRARTGGDCLAPGQPPIEGFVFVRGPLVPEGPFDLDAFVPGRDLFLARVMGPDLVPFEIENLTADLHPDDPADIRDPAVSRDGRHVLFTMRIAAERGHHVWMLDLETRAVRRLTRDESPPSDVVASDRDPTFGPDGSVWFVSTRAGALSDGGDRLDAELYSLDPDTGELRRWTHTPHIERKPTFFTIGEEAGRQVAFTALRDAVPGQRRAHPFRFPLDLRTEYHQHFGITPVPNLFFDMRELPDGRYVTLVGDLSNTWTAGALGVVDRNLGPEINERAASAAPALDPYLPPWTRIDPEAQAASVTRGTYLDPAPLPDGRLLAAYDPAERDLSTSGAPLVPRIVLVTLREALDGSGPTLAERRVLLEEAGIALSDPEPIAALAPLPISMPSAWSDDATGTLLHQGVPMIDALLSNLAPSGPKHPRDDIRFVRLIEALPRTPEQRAPVDATQTRFGIASATTTSLSGYAPARILAELPLAADGSFQARVPAGVPFRIQPLDAERMAIGAEHNRWFYVLPGQVLRQGVGSANGPGAYSSQCAACHGHPNGEGLARPELADPDVLTAASFTLSRYRDQNPRRPIDPPLLGDETRVSVDFVRDVGPLLARRCASDECHSGEAAPSLTDAPTRWYTDAYETLLAPDRGWVVPGRARASHLVERLLGRELNAPAESERTPHPPSLDEAEISTIVRWIDLGASFDAGGGASP